LRIIEFEKQNYEYLAKHLIIKGNLSLIKQKSCFLIDSNYLNLTKLYQMSVNKKDPYPQTKPLEQYEKIVNAIPDLERKGKKTPYTSLNGHMFSFLDKDGVLSIRLSEEERVALIEKYNTQLSVQHGRIMKEYVVVPDSLFNN